MFKETFTLRESGKADALGDGLKALVEIAGIELAYARAEIALTTRMGDAKSRISDHLDAAMDTLDKLQLSVDELEILGRPRRMTRKHVARLRAAKSHARNIEKVRQADA